jgi:hypothetical protein
MVDVHSSDAQALQEARAEVVHSREQLITAGMALRTELRRSVDWRAWYRRAPGAWLGGALVVGFLLGGGLNPRR